MAASQRERDMCAVTAFFSRDISRAHKAIFTHQPHARGWCLGCGCVRYTRWPCWLYTLATAAVDTRATAIARAEFINALIPRQRVGPRPLPVKGRP